MAEKKMTGQDMICHDRTRYDRTGQGSDPSAMPPSDTDRAKLPLPSDTPNDIPNGPPRTGRDRWTRQDMPERDRTVTQVIPAK